MQNTDKIKHFPLRWDSGKIQTLKRCAYQGELKLLYHLRQLEETEASTDLVAGGAFAAGVEAAKKAFYASPDILDKYIYMDKAIDAASEAYGEHLSDYNYKTLEHVIKALQVYFDTWALRNDTAKPLKLADGNLAIEWKVEIPLDIMHPDYDIPLIFVGKFDSVVNFFGSNWAMDEKTSNRRLNMNAVERSRSRGQFIGYKWLLSQVGIDIAGVLKRHVVINSKPSAEQHPLEIESASVDRWLESLYLTLKDFIAVYKGERKSARTFGEGCEVYNRSCTYHDLCVSSQTNFFMSQFTQAKYVPEEGQYIPLKDFVAKLEAGDL